MRTPSFLTKHPKWERAPLNDAQRKHYRGLPYQHYSVRITRTTDHTVVVPSVDDPTQDDPMSCVHLRYNLNSFFRSEGLPYEASVVGTRSGFIS